MRRKPSHPGDRGSPVTGTRQIDQRAGCVTRPLVLRVGRHPISEWRVPELVARAGGCCYSLSVPMNEPRQVSMHCQTAIDQDRLSGHEVTVVRSKKQQRADEVVRCFLAFERPALDVEPAHRYNRCGPLPCYSA